MCKSREKKLQTENEDENRSKSRSEAKLYKIKPTIKPNELWSSIIIPLQKERNKKSERNPRQIDASTVKNSCTNHTSFSFVFEWIKQLQPKKIAPFVYRKKRENKIQDGNDDS